MCVCVCVQACVWMCGEVSVTSLHHYSVCVCVCMHVSTCMCVVCVWHSHILPLSLFQMEPPASRRPVSGGIPRGQHRSSRRRVHPVPVGVHLPTGPVVFASGCIYHFRGRQRRTCQRFQSSLSLLAAFRSAPSAHRERGWRFCLTQTSFLHLCFPLLMRGGYDLNACNNVRDILYNADVISHC